jgi:C_GCAxxG_C_C family probable redox protein
MDSKEEIAVELMDNGYNCAQAVLASQSDAYGLDSTLAKKVAAAFGGGIAYNGHVCGAVTGALMLIGLKHGKYKDGDNESKERTNRIANEYIQKFKEEHGSIMCKDLIKYDLSKSDELRKAREAGVFTEICLELVRSSAELVGEILET